MVFWVLCACITTTIKTNSINLNETLFIYMKKINLISHFFLRYYTLKNPAIWLVKSILLHNQNFGRQRICGEIKMKTIFQFRSFLIFIIRQRAVGSYLSRFPTPTWIQSISHTYLNSVNPPLTKKKVHGLW